jgi:hypothetical protein
MRAPHDPDYGYHDARTPPAAHLVYAIIAQAVQDLFGSPGSYLTASQSSMARRDAMAFLTAASGKSAHWRKTYCDLVGLDEEVLRAHIVAILEGGDAPTLAYGVGKNPAGLAEAHAMWAERPRLSQSDLPTRLPRIIPNPHLFPVIFAEPPEQRPRPQAPVLPYAEVRTRVHALLTKPHAFRDLIIATNGDMSDSVIRTVLRNGLEKRELSRDTNGRYLLRAS